MKTLELNQMENLEGGSMWTCIGFGTSGAGAIISFAAVATGPVGWAAIGLGLSIIGMASTLIENGDDTCAG